MEAIPLCVIWIEGSIARRIWFPFNTFLENKERVYELI
jgi:hypothetical protein